MNMYQQSGDESDSNETSGSEEEGSGEDSDSGEDTEGLLCTLASSLIAKYFIKKILNLIKSLHGRNSAILLHVEDISICQQLCFYLNFYQYSRRC